MSFAKSSVVKKSIMGLSGLMLCGFLVVHLIGNTLMYAGPQQFNNYAHKLMSMTPIIYVAEVVLLLIFIVHAGMGVRLTIENNAARPEKYYYKKRTGRGATFASATMSYTGIIFLLFFTVIHLINFKYGKHYTATYDGVVVRDLYVLVLEFFRSPVNVIGYIVAMVAAGLHTSHGFWSAFQSLGFDHPRYTPILKVIAKAYAVIITIGFCSFPIWAYLQGGSSL